MADGTAAIDLGKLRPFQELLDTHVLEVRSSGHKLASLDLAELPLMVTWRETVADERAAQQERVAASEAIREERPQDSLRASVDAKLATRRAALDELGRLAPPWSSEKVASLVSAGKAVTGLP